MSLIPDSTGGRGAAIWLLVPTQTKLPKWFVSHDWGANVLLVRSQIFKDVDVGLSDFATTDGFTIRVSRRERAVMEAINLIDKYHRFEEVAEYFEGLTSLDPEVVQHLLTHCSSVKVRRIFLYLARESGHTWFAKIQENEVDLGSGKREVVKGGRLDLRYLITVPIREESDV